MASINFSYFDASPQASSHIYLPKAQRYKEPVEGNLEDAIAAIFRSLECGGDQESNDDDLRVLIKQT